MPGSVKGWVFFGLAVIAVLFVFNVLILPMLPSGIAGFLRPATSA